MEVVDVDDVLVLERCKRFCFAFKAPSELLVPTQLGLQGLNRHGSMQCVLNCSVHNGHASGRYFTDDSTISDPLQHLVFTLSKTAVDSRRQGGVYAPSFKTNGPVAQLVRALA